ncbi:uroporphyrinogen decarboxylase [Plasmodium falciparum Santa Lucia]|uniref:Uroporphyrinogen decarboxylase n=14 Tax=Plasmodium falciparum TaxID=5833 RepID=C6KSS1_PLAF7|nr:uroporphyrinogen III decarboxylase [Plasmodium falciparum 3D7]AAZ08395.1 uroporphyrinogen III decarboxylase [Plasmodium falciparum]ETW19838.1 uroporphyrinogen decarboxylase [Plasmodium falciparum Vietnam Oak-Knoll (FVO)]ETW37940.1 uroporphyrinogen decarboxylase [Plasmodium falciparum Tanzania (2000708)]ETW44164.1 uroporphyrinogen decarboxylase [Plasmodium falciparum NF135/5.C10]ETW50609.1 uroporphyrinogen decarboxylase [Plasmodium falciparum MaliPS096_E11]ETW53281.1 uroporphyrinogen decarb|eukprot:XP_966063.1 uroporphyrinogen III decarboxylase [Plasmodium falciparum 3D7]
MLKCLVTPLLICILTIKILCFINLKKLRFNIIKTETILNMNEVGEIYSRPENLKYEKFGRPQNDLILNVIENKNEEKKFKKIPLWIMRQAGRYLPEYVEIRKKYDFFEICKSPDLSSYVSIMPYDRFKTDMIVIFSDILIIFVAMGIDIKFVENLGPVFNLEIYNMNDFNKLNLNMKEIIDNLYYVYDSINLTKKKINNDVPILGFCGSPFTLFMYLTKNNKKTYEDSFKFLYEKPNDAHQIINKLSDICLNHLINQIDSGANIIQIFDSNAELVDKNIFNEFSIIYLKKVIEIIKKYRPNIYIILFIKNNFHDDIKNLKIDVLSITHKQLIDNTDQFYFKLFQNNIILQGALDPYILLLNDHELIQKHIIQMMKNITHKNKYIANLGHGILPTTKIKNVNLFIDTIRNNEWS